MTYLIDRDQEFRLEQDVIVEEIYLEGVTDGADGRLPAMPDVVYLQGFCEGMRQLRKKVRLFPVPVPTDVKEFPLLCRQCEYLVDGFCAIKGTARNSSNFACDHIKVDCPF